MDTWELKIFEKTRAEKKNVLGHAIKKLHKFKGQEIFDGIDWTQQNLEKIFISNQKQISGKRAGIHSTVKKLMAKEWAAAWGKTNNQNVDCLEREAAYWNRKMESKKKE